MLPFRRAFGQIAVIVTAFAVFGGAESDADTAAEFDIRKASTDSTPFWEREIYLCEGNGRYGVEGLLYGRYWGDGRVQHDPEGGFCHKYFGGQIPLNVNEMMRKTGYTPRPESVAAACCFEVLDEKVRHGCPRWRAVMFCDREKFRTINEEAGIAFEPAAKVSTKSLAPPTSDAEKPDCSVYKSIPHVILLLNPGPAIYHLVYSNLCVDRIQ